MKDDFRRERAILDRGYREFMGLSEYPCDHGNRDVVVDDAGIVRLYCIDCRLTAWAGFEDAQTLGWIEEW